MPSARQSNVAHLRCPYGLYAFVIRKISDQERHRAISIILGITINLKASLPSTKSLELTYLEVRNFLSFR